MMRKIIITLVLVLAASSLMAQYSSRLLVGAGGGIGFVGKKPENINKKNNPYDNKLGGMGSIGFNYVFTRDFTAFGIGFKTGVDLLYSGPRLKARSLTDLSVEQGIGGREYQYTINTYDVNYSQQALNLDIPVMFAFKSDMIYFNIGVKFLLPLWNRYTQTISECNISAYSPNEAKTYINEPLTGVLSDAQKSLSDRETVAPAYVAFSMEFGLVWGLKNGHHVGFEIFADPVSWGIGASTPSDPLSVVEVDPATVAGTVATVRVNTLPNCYGFTNSYANMGVRFVYCFDIEHKAKNVAPKETIYLME